MAGSRHEFSVVDYYAEHERYRCGYCKSVDTNYSHGMWAHTMSVNDYQDLIDRGWRRSGRYCYKPTMDVTCCPMYTIRCLATDLKLSKSQKKVLKRMHRFLLCGDLKTKEGAAGESSVRPSPEHPVDPLFISVKSATAEQNSEKAVVSSVDPTLAGRIGSILMNLTDTLADTFSGASRDTGASVNTIQKETDSASSASDTSGPKKKVQSGKGGDLMLPPCKKAKLMRLERKKGKLMKKGFSAVEAEKAITDCKKPGNESKSVEELFTEPFADVPKHKLEIRLVRSSPPSVEFEQTSEQAHEVYQKYQMAIHGDSPDKCSLRQYTRFLVSSPLQAWRPADGPPCGYGSFHQQYWLDGRLIAVGVIDILPKCVSSVYFYYDPDVGHLSLGTYGSLRELYFTRTLQKSAPDLKYYYMGFYIHTCPKMRYKAAYFPSFLLCPETYSWHSVEKCKPKLDVSRYARFEEDKSVKDPDGNTVISDVLVLYRNTAMPFSMYATSVREEIADIRATRQYAELVGMKCARNMLLVKH